MASRMWVATWLYGASERIAIVALWGFVVSKGPGGQRTILRLDMTTRLDDWLLWLFWLKAGEILSKARRKSSAFVEYFWRIVQN